MAFWDITTACKRESEKKKKKVYRRASSDSRAQSESCVWRCPWHSFIPQRGWTRCAGKHDIIITDRHFQINHLRSPFALFKLFSRASGGFLTSHCSNHRLWKSLSPPPSCLLDCRSTFAPSSKHINWKRNARFGLLFLIKQRLLFSLHVDQVLELLICHLNTFCIQEFPMFFSKCSVSDAFPSCQE